MSLQRLGGSGVNPHLRQPEPVAVLRRLLDRVHRRWGRVARPLMDCDYRALVQAQAGPCHELRHDGRGCGRACRPDRHFS